MLTKEKFFNYMFCERYGWVADRGLAREPFSAGEELRAINGRMVGEKARGLFPGAVFVKADEMKAAAAETHRLMRDGAADAYIEAGFIHEGAGARADIIARNGDGWDLIEVKSGTSGPSPEELEARDEYIEDIAYTLMVMHGAGIKVKKAYLYLISKDYRKGMPDERIFARVDATRAAAKIAKAFDRERERLTAIEKSSEEPEFEHKYRCRHCPELDDCAGRDVKDLIFIIPKLGEKKADALLSEMIYDVRDIGDPRRFGFTATQMAVIEATAAGREFVDKRTLERLLNLVKWPAYYLDFETISLPLPLFDGQAPYAPVVTQFSMHKREGVRSNIEHYEYIIDDPGSDARRETAEKLIEAAGDWGSIIVYNKAFESSRIAEMAAMFPDLAPKLDDINERIFDLMRAFSPLIYYDPKFDGSMSIKKVLPALVPDLGYAGLKIGDGDTASAEFAKMALGITDKKKFGAVKKALLEYCRTDTLAMVKLHEKLLEKLH